MRHLVRTSARIEIEVAFEIIDRSFDFLLMSRLCLTNLSKFDDVLDRSRTERCSFGR
jgi:hypothetical protein